jgi:uncharacterized membrane protein (UPF0127 family)
MPSEQGAETMHLWVADLASWVMILFLEQNGRFVKITHAQPEGTRSPSELMLIE